MVYLKCDHTRAKNIQYSIIVPYSAIRSRFQILDCGMAFASLLNKPALNAITTGSALPRNHLVNTGINIDRYKTPIKHYPPTSLSSLSRQQYHASTTASTCPSHISKIHPISRTLLNTTTSTRISNNQSQTHVSHPQYTYHTKDHQSPP